MEMFAKRLKERREELKLTQRDLAQKAGIASTSLSAYENGRKLPAVDGAFKLAEALGVSLDWLCGKEPDSIGIETKTYADLIRFFIEIGGRMRYMSVGASDVDFDKAPEVPFEERDNFFEEEAHGKLIYYNSCAYLHVRDEKIAKFFTEWERVRNLRLTDVIDDEMYRLWLAKRIADGQRIPLPNSFL